VACRADIDPAFGWGRHISFIRPKAGIVTGFRTTGTGCLAVALSRNEKVNVWREEWADSLKQRGYLKNHEHKRRNARRVSVT
jgi:hypothetical protein